MTVIVTVVATTSTAVVCIERASARFCVTVDEFVPSEKPHCT